MNKGILRFTPPARAALTVAQEETVSRGQPLIRLEHIMLGLLHDESSPAGRILRDVGLSAGAVKAALDEIQQPTTESGVTDLDEAVKALLERTVQIAAQRGDQAVDTEHLLLGVLQLADTSAHDMLSRLGFDTEAARVRIDAYMQGLDS